MPQPQSATCEAEPGNDKRPGGGFRDGAGRDCEGVSPIAFWGIEPDKQITKAGLRHRAHDTAFFRTDWPDILEKSAKAVVEIYIVVPQVTGHDITRVAQGDGSSGDSEIRNRAGPVRVDGACCRAFVRAKAEIKHAGQGFDPELGKGRKLLIIVCCCKLGVLEL